MQITREPNPVEQFEQELVVLLLRAEKAGASAEDLCVVLESAAAFGWDEKTVFGKDNP